MKFDIKRFEEIDNELNTISETLRTPTIIVEDGSVDVDKLEREYGFRVIVYRQGSTPPVFEDFDTILKRYMFLKMELEELKEDLK